jgi:hypothetical protein
MFDRYRSAIFLLALIAVSFVTTMQLNGWFVRDTEPSLAIAPHQLGSADPKRGAPITLPLLRQNLPNPSSAEAPLSESPPTLGDMVRAEDPELRTEAEAVQSAITQESFD